MKMNCEDSECRSVAPGSEHVVTLPEGTTWIGVRDQSTGVLLEMVSAQTLMDFILIMGSLQKPGLNRYQLCDGSGGGFRPRGRSPHCRCLNSVADLDRLLANRDVAWSLMVDLQLDAESQFESRLAAALFDV